MTSAIPFSSLQALLAEPAAAAKASCQRCGAALEADHLHLARIDTRTLVCVCADCYGADGAGEGDERRVPRRLRRWPAAVIGEPEWSRLEVPVGLAFFFHNSTIDRLVLCYPGAAGVVESQLPLASLADMPALDHVLGMLAPDVEALLVRRTSSGSQDVFLVPIDSCYELAGLIRSYWRGFGGGADVQRKLDGFFARLARECDAGGSAA